MATETGRSSRNPDSGGSPEGPAEPRSRVCRDGRVLRCAGYEEEIRWQEGERLEQLFEQRCDSLREQGAEDRLAVDGPDVSLTYAELDARANQLARFLKDRGAVAPGDRVGLLFDDAVDAYRGMLATLKLHAAYVPLDAGFPQERISYIVSDAEVKTILTRSDLAEPLSELEGDITLILLDDEHEEIDKQDEDRLQFDGSGDADDDLAYLIYTSGTTGRPKGVAIGHPSICNFVRVAAEVYGIAPDDRVYQGLTIAFDFAVEEIWVPWMAGATLVPKPRGGNLLGPELCSFLGEHRISALCCVPTLLATLEKDLPELRFLLVSGEACPKDLVERWHTAERRFLNVYGPTEATVSATWTELEPDKPVTIGVPLPTYSILILDPDEDEARPLDQEGEIAIAGIGLADGYLGNQEKTDEAFIEDFLELPDNPSQRIYRTGDLGKVNEDGELEHLGRIDTQVKIRGYRIELEEIESLLRGEPGVDQAVVSTHQPEPEVDELVAYVKPESDRDGVDEDKLHEELGEKLPPYMVPAYLEQVEDVPTQPSGKVDRDKLPEPQGQRRLAAQGEHVEADSELESALAEKLAGVLDVESVSVESHFFDELGASSLLMSQWTTELRKSPDLPNVSIKDLYTHPTIRSLAQAMSDGGGEGIAQAPEWDEPELPDPVGTPHYALCGALQVLAFLAYVSLAGVAFDLGSSWVTGAHGAVSVYLHALVAGAALVLAAGGLPVLVKWALVGRLEPQRIRIWSLAYVRFWIVKTMVLANPAVTLLRGTLLYRYYLLALGAKIEPGAMLLSEHTPICADMISIGAGAVIRRNTYLNGYRARDGMIEIGPVSVGADAFVGERCVLDIHSTLEDGATVGHGSSVHAGQRVPAGETWHGSPVQPAEEDWEYRMADPLPVGTARRLAFNLALGLLVLLVGAPAQAVAVFFLLAHPDFIVSLSTQDALLIGAGFVLAGLALALAVVGVVPRLLSRLLKPGEAYPLFGLRYAILRIVTRVSNVPVLTRLFGDSVAIDRYLRYVGWRMDEVEHSGSNFGLNVSQEIPSLTSIGTGTMVSDGLSVMNADFSSSSFRVRPVEIGARCFLGNGIAWPPGARTGENLLLATKAMVPVGGEVRSDTGLLGSPCFEIPRSTDDDEELERVQREPERSRRLRSKTRHNLLTMALYLFSRFVFVAGLLALAFAPLGGWLGTGGSELIEVALLPVVVFSLAEVAAGSRRIKPQTCPILDRGFWRIERIWKLKSMLYLRMFDGTPFKGILWRLLGVKVGPRLYDDGCGISEPGLTTIGPDVTLNMGAEIQGHSLENGMFKSDRIDIGGGATVGVTALVHYGTRIGEHGVLEADTFLMKGSDVPDGTRWRGNPAMEV